MEIGLCVCVSVLSITVSVSAADRFQDFTKAYNRRITSEMQVGIGPGLDRKFQLQPRPILNWSNLRNGYYGAQIFVWLKDERPAALSGILHWPRSSKVVWEFVNLTEDPLVARHENKLIWNGAEKDSVKWFPVPDASPPSSARGTRLIQMRRIAKRFSVHAVKQPPNYDKDSMWKLRFVTQPLYRYEPGDGDVVDGSIFAFSQETDPEAVLLLEARKSTSSQGMRWHFAFARLSSWETHAQYNGKEVWSVPLILGFPLPQGRSFFQVQKPVDYPPRPSK